MTQLVVASYTKIVYLVTRYKILWTFVTDYKSLDNYLYFILRENYVIIKINKIYVVIILFYF